MRPNSGRGGLSRAGRTAHIRRGRRTARCVERCGAEGGKRGGGGVGLGGSRGRGMEPGWLLWGAAVLLLLHLLMELSSAVNFVVRIGFYYVLCIVCSGLTAPVCLLVNGGRTVKNMRWVGAEGGVGVPAVGVARSCRWGGGGLGDAMGGCVCCVKWELFPPGRWAGGVLSLGWGLLPAVHQSEMEPQWGCGMLGPKPRRPRSSHGCARRAPRRHIVSFQRDVGRPHVC